MKYLKREFTIIFLILLAPISCITYPIDKISDGKAQAYNKWFSEFLYQVIIQPFHLLLYIVLIGSAVELANANVIYALVCFAVLIPAEKFIKEMFGFKDKLGSPLGAMAAGALGAKALSSIMNKGKGSGGGVEKGDGNNNSTPNQLPPKTVDKPGLVGGTNNTPNDGGAEGGNTPRSIEQTETPELEAGRESGEEPGGGASAAAAYQNSDDPIGDAERAALEEKIADGQIDEDELTDEQRNLLGRGNDDEPDSPENSPNPQANTAESGEEVSQNQQSRWDKIKQGAKEKGQKALAIHNQRVSKKYGSTNRGQRWKRRIIKGAKAGAKGILKGGAIGMVGAAAMAGAIMTGNGKEALGIATGIGAYAGKKVLNTGKKVITGAKGAVKDYNNGLRSDKSKEKKALKEFKADPNQVDKAVMSYRENHKGQEPSYEALDQEMNDRFALSRYGLDDEQIDRAIGSYQELKDPKKGGLSEADALNQTVYAAKLAKDYSKKDFRSEKTMKEATDTISKQFQSYGVSKEVAEANARKYLTQAAKIKGAEIALPSTEQTVDVPVNREVPNVSSSLGLGEANLTTNQLERMNRITVRLRDAGFNKGEIEKVASNSSGGSVNEVLNKYETNVQYLGNENAQEEARKLIESKNNGRNATEKQVQTEMKERLILKSTFDVKNEKDISAMRSMETEDLKGKTQVQAAREFAVKNKGKLKDIPHMTKAKGDLVEKLKAGGSSRDKAWKDADNIVNLAAHYNNEI